MKVLVDTPIWSHVLRRKYRPENAATAVELASLMQDGRIAMIGLIRQAKKPMLYVGGGIISGEAHQELLEFAERAQIPVATTLMGVGCFPETHELSLKWLGMHGYLKPKT